MPPDAPGGGGSLKLDGLTDVHFCLSCRAGNREGRSSGRCRSFLRQASSLVDGIGRPGTCPIRANREGDLLGVFGVTGDGGWSLTVRCELRLLRTHEFRLTTVRCRVPNAGRCNFRGHFHRKASRPSTLNLYWPTEPRLHRTNA